jgi:PST family polysaccharide transporter
VWYHAGSSATAWLVASAVDGIVQVNHARASRPDPAATIAAVASTSEQPSEAAAPDSSRRIDTKGLSLRAFAAKGVIVNTAFDVGITLLNLVRGFILAALLTASDYGVWGVLVVSIGVLARLKLVGVSDKYIQQEDTDQELAFQRAFTIETIITAIAVVPLIIALPVVAVVYGEWKLVAPGAVLISVMAADALQSPLWIYYRHMDFVRQRLFSSVEPVVGFVVSIALAAAGAGYWALAVGVTAGAWAGAAVAVVRSPYPLRWRYDSGSLRVYAAFSGPLFVATLCSVVLANSGAIASNAALGLAGVGALALAANITAFTSKVDDLVSGTLYPAICAIQHRVDLLGESFVKSNRLAMMWGMPFGAALALFAADLVHFGIGDQWQSAVVLLQITGVVAAIGQIGFNWDDYFRARGTTMPVAITAVAVTVAFLAVGVPLVFSDGLTGLGIGLAVQAAVGLACRAWYLSQLFEGFRFVRHAVRAILPTIPGVLVVLLARQLEHGSRTLPLAIAELCVYVIVTIAATWILERRLVREAVGYLLARAVQPAPTAG